MVAGLDLALAIRPLQDQTRGNVLVQARGIHFLTACDAVAEAGTILASYLAKKPINDGKGDLPPAGPSGHLSVLGGQYIVTYRLLSGIILALVTQPSASAFLAVSVLDAATRVLLGLTRGSAVTPAKVAARFPEAYAALDDLLGLGLDRLIPGFHHAPLDDRVRLSLPVSATDAKRQFRRLVKTARGASEAGSVAGDEQHVDETAAAAAPLGLAARGSPLAGISFAIPADALPPPPLRALRRAPVRAPAVVVVQQPAPPVQTFQGAVPDEPKEPEPAAVEPEVVEEDGWAVFGADAQDGRPATGDLGTEKEGKSAAGAEEVPAAPLPTVSDEDVLESLQLVEVWRGRAAGGSLVEAGTEGSVRRRLAPWGLDSTDFRVLASATASGYLRYRLPAVAVAPPLEADLRLLRAGPGGALCVLRWVACPALPGPGLFDLAVDLALPHGLTLVKASMPTLWRPDTCQARVAVPTLGPGQAGTLSLALDAGPEAWGADVPPPTATLTFTGPAGATLSGTRLEVGLGRGKGGAGLPGKALFFGRLEVQA